ncbi:hypothetical protein B296_00047057 [Ensete ventricosum]|uniref:Uncharacterized protein n=1 Tax=Ensete ventricosum TaxID=4639 RepID=A0A426X5D2_ENSVE|nr:hypothetical protein B296_00047057 [Ensete ventricosum]
MDLGELRGMPKVTSGKVLLTSPAAREVGASPTRQAPKASLKRPVDAPIEQAEDAARCHKKVKVLTRRNNPVSTRGSPAPDQKARSPQHCRRSLRRPPGPRRGELHRPIAARGR